MIDSSDIRVRNKSRIWREMLSRKKYTKQQMAFALGLSVATCNTLLNELKEEKIDVVEWSEDPVQYIASALSPATVLAVDINEEEMTSKVVVPDSQLSLAIGKDGQNARLSAKLTGWKIDIKSESQIKGEA